MYDETRQKAKRLVNYADEINALVFRDDDLVLTAYNDRFIAGLEEIILLATELRIKYKIHNVTETEKENN